MARGMHAWSLESFEDGARISTRDLETIENSGGTHRLFPT